MSGHPSLAGVGNEADRCRLVLGSSVQGEALDESLCFFELVSKLEPGVFGR